MHSSVHQILQEKSENGREKWEWHGRVVDNYRVGLPAPAFPIAFVQVLLHFEISLT
jgi:hypothetical protein